MSTPFASSGEPDSGMRKAELLRALALMEEALMIVDEAGRPGGCDPYLDQAIESLRETLGITGPRP